MRELNVVEVFENIDVAVKPAPLFSRQQSGQLVMDETALDRLLIGKGPIARNFARRRLKLLFDRCSKDVKEGRIHLEAVNKLATFCLDIIPLIESERIVSPTATEMSILFNWYLDRFMRSQSEPAVVLSTVCPDYPYDWMGTKAVFNNGVVRDDIGLVGESIQEHAPPLLQVLEDSLQVPIVWIVAYAGFEAKPENLERMKISAKEFENRLETSALKLQQKLGVPVGILPGAVGFTMEQFKETRENFSREDFNIKRKGMDALDDAVDARDWAGVFCLANKLDAIILDGASVYMGRKAYKKTEQIIQSKNHTPRFFCVCNYMGFAE